MRDIIFRGKWKDTGEWFEGYHVCIGETYHYICTGKLDISGVVPTFEHYLVYPETVGQYTGLIDKNGVEIFEGDILLFDFEDIGKQKAIVEWCQKYTTYQLRPLDNFKYVEMSEGTVIGNVHDNQELLEVKKWPEK